MGRLDERAARAWELVAIEHMHLLRRRGVISFTGIGRWWWRDTEINIVAVDEETGTAYFVECKWGEADHHTLARLMAKAKSFPWRQGSRREVYMIYARRVRGAESRGDVMVYTLEQVEENFRKEPVRVEAI